MKKKVALIFGGRSSEHEVSVQSAKNIFKAIDLNLFEVVLVGISKQGTWFSISEKKLDQISFIDDNEMEHLNIVSVISYLGKTFIYTIENKKKMQIDCAFPITHGTNGEDGTLQGLLKLMNIPFVGCDVLSSALCMDKEFMKIVLTSAGIKNSRYLVLRRNKFISYDEISSQIGSPFFIKPANAGSSVGVHKIKSNIEFESKLSDSFKYDFKVIAEEFIAGREIECSVSGANQNPKVSIPGELIVKHEFYSYEAKYLDADGAEVVIPARINSEISKKIQTLAIQAYKILSCDGLARIDFFLKENGDIYINELNTLPGFTKISMYPKMWEATGIKYSSLITELIYAAFEKFDLDLTISKSRI